MNWNNDQSQVMIFEKSRRIGVSWADAARSVLHSSDRQGANSYYIGYNKEMAQTYIQDCAEWAKYFNLQFSGSESIFADPSNPDKSIFVYKIEFLSGFRITALSSRPSNLRSKGKPKEAIVIDEAAFHEDLDELLKAAMAFMIWGGQVRLISTHNGVDNPFNVLVKQVREGKFNYSLHRTTFDDALKQGFFRLRSYLLGLPYSSEDERHFRDSIYSEYGVTAAEELDCIPLDARGGGKIFQKAWWQILDIQPEALWHVRFWDMAATARHLKEDAFYTAGVKLGFDGQNYYVVDIVYDQLSPADSDRLFVEIAAKDGYRCPIRWELEGGSAGLRVEENLKQLLRSYDACGVKPMGDKVTRAIPFANAVKQGKVFLIKAPWNQSYIDSLFRFDGTPQPLVNDLADASSGAFDYLAGAIPLSIKKVGTKASSSLLRGF